MSSWVTDAEIKRFHLNVQSALITHGTDSFFSEIWQGDKSRYALGRAVNKHALGITHRLAHKVCELNIEDSPIKEAMVQRWASAARPARASDLYSLSSIFVQAIEHGASLSVVGYGDLGSSRPRSLSIGIAALTPIDVVVFQDDARSLPFELEHSDLTTLGQLDAHGVPYVYGDNVSTGDEIFARIHLYSKGPTWERCTVIGTTGNGKLIREIHGIYVAEWERAEQELTASGAFNEEFQ